MYYPSLPEIKRLAGEYNLIPVYREIVADLETPVSAFLKVNSGSNYSFLLESIEGGERIARYSYIGIAPRRILTSLGTCTEASLEQISSELGKYRIAPIGELTGFCGGAVGYLGYETVNRFEKLPSPVKDSLGLPEAMFMLVDTMLIFDHLTHRIKVLSYVYTDNVEKSYSKAIERIDNLVRCLNRPLGETNTNIKVSRQIPQVSSNIKQRDFEKSVLKIKQYITSGEAIQVVLSQRLSRPTDAPPFEIYRALRTVNPSPYMYYLDFSDFQIIGSSPEILVKVENGNVMTRPLAGTRPRGRTPAEDAHLEEELRHDEKERAEHVMLVDLGRNDIGRVSEPGTVKVTDLMNVERYSHVMHLVTHVQGKLQSGLNAFDALRACFPAGTVSGAPKIRAMEIIAEMEPEKRGVYAGAVGYFSYNGNMDMAIAIRTIVMQKKIAYVQAGCGVVYDSVPKREYEESLNKAQALLKAIEQAET